MSSAFRIEDLLRHDAYPHPVERLELRETHISWIVLTGAWAYKIKKAVKFEFIDASTLELRKQLCHEELRLNKRLAPELYVDVAPLVPNGDRVMFGSDGPAIEYAVRMKQFPAEDELRALLKTRSVADDDSVELAQLIADFHARAAVAAPRRERNRWEINDDSIFQNLKELEELGEPEFRQCIAPLGVWMRDRQSSQRELRAARARHGFIRECHGDLHAGNVVRLKDRLVPFDCLEFNPDLRWIDVIDDLAFLFMDLKYRRRADLAHLLLNRYLEAGGDYQGARLLPFYAVHRALVRAKVDMLSVRQSARAAEDPRMSVRRRLDTALALTEPDRKRALILMHGVSGSGKSWLSEKLIAPLSAVRVRSDVERKRLAESWPEGAEAGGLYTKRITQAVYARALECASDCLQGGMTTLVDATFLDPAELEPFRDLARSMQIPYLVLSCRADYATLQERLERRRADRLDPSDADLSVLRRQLDAAQPIRGDAAAHVIDVETRAANAVEAALTAIRMRT